MAEIGRAELNSELIEAVGKGRIYSGGASWNIIDISIPVQMDGLMEIKLILVIVAKVLSRGADPNLTLTQDSDILSMCHLAVKQNNISILALLTSYRYFCIYVQRCMSSLVSSLPVDCYYFASISRGDYNGRINLNDFSNRNARTSM